MRAEKTCEIVRDLLPSLADGLVAPKTDAWVKAHLAECPECRAISEKIMEQANNTEVSKVKETSSSGVRFFKSVKKKSMVSTIITVLLLSGMLFGIFFLLTEVKFYVPTKDMTVEATPLSLLDSYDQVIIYSYEVTIDKKYGTARQEEMSKQLIPDEELGNIEEYSCRFYYTLWDYLFRANRETTVSIDIRGDSFDPEIFDSESEENAPYDFYMGLATPTSIYIKGNSESDRFFLWENLEILDAMNKILDRSAAPEALTADSDGRQIVTENEEVVLRTDISEKSGMLQEDALYPVTQEDLEEKLYLNLLVHGFSSEELKALGETGIYNNTLIEMTGTEFSASDLYSENAFDSVPDDSVVQIMNSTLHVSSGTPIPPCVGYRYFNIDTNASGAEYLYNPEIATAEEYCTRQYRSVTFVNGHREVVQDWAYQVTADLITYQVKNHCQPYDSKDGSGPLYGVLSF